MRVNFRESSRSGEQAAGLLQGSAATELVRYGPE